MNLRGKTVLVLGMGDTGLSMIKWLSRLGAVVRVADTRDTPPNIDVIMENYPDVERYVGQFKEKIFSDIAMIALSPGVPLAELNIQQAQKRGVPVVGDVELFAHALANSDIPQQKILAITGSNGKTTVTAMVGEMMKQSGWDVAVAGNIGPAVLDVFMERLDAGCMPQSWVLELSSFQLETTQSLNADVATVLNISEDHLDRYQDIDAYAATKARIFMNDQPDAGIQVLNQDDSKVSAMTLPDRQHIMFGLSASANRNSFGMIEDGDDIWLMHGDEQLIKVSELTVSGLHNALNALAALAMCHAVDLPVASLLPTLRQFKGLPHRMEKVAKINGVTFYNDSKSTNVGATVAALNGLRQGVILIAGGEGKDQDFSPLNRAISNNASGVILLGRDAGKIEGAIKDCDVPVYFAESLREAVQKSLLVAHEGQTVLLSPACASFDLFDNYIHRGEVFVKAVREMAEKFFYLGQKRH